MKKRLFPLSSLLIATVALFSVLLVQCKKDGTNASTIDRSFTLSQLDNGLFSPFYDTTKIPVADAVADVNDVVQKAGVLNFITNNCATADCHGGKVSPTLTSYAAIKSLVTPGIPESSKLWDVLTTNNLNKAMPPVNRLHEPSYTEKNMIYNWIANGAKEYPAYDDYKAAAVRIITTGCTSANCHNEATAVGYWARKPFFTLAATDTASFPLANQATGAITYYPVVTNATLLNAVWGSYKDSVRKFFTDTLANASFRPYKTFGTPVSVASHRGPLSTYDDILLDVLYPKSIRSNSTVVYTNPTTSAKYYVKGDYLNASSSIVSRIDSTLLLANPRTGVFATAHQADMAWSDGGFGKNDIAIVKGWYFLDPNIPDVWKYGINNAGIFKYRKSGNIIKK